jgi:uncharacterized protein (TIGR03437 family)
MLRVVLAALVVSALGAQTYEERALQISRDIRARHLPFGTILDPMYETAESDRIVAYSRCGDSAIWTGHWLAAEAFRYSVTRSPEALEAVRLGVHGIQSLVDVTGSENLLARCVLRADSYLNAAPRNEERQHGEYLGKVDGVDHYWIGNTSRDQYMGAFFGLSVAYEQVSDAGLRSTISNIATRLIDRLLAKEWAVVMPGGRVSTLFWLRPDQQLAILQVGRQVNATRFAPIYDDLRRRATGLQTIMSLEASDPHESYFKFNLAATTFYNLIRLEEPGSSKRDAYLEAYRTFRRAVAQHGNAFFNIIDRVLSGPDAARDAETMELVAAWTLRPRRDTWTDLRGKYPACDEDRACQPIPVVERVRTDFLWQRSPFLLYGGGEGKIEAPGIDFILPYWMARHYGLDLNLLAVSAASGASLLAPDSIATLYGAGFPANARVEVTDSAGIAHIAPVFFAGAEQINFVIPAGVAIGPARVGVMSSNGARTHSTVAAIERFAPAVFSANATGKGVVAALAIRVEPNGAQSDVPVFRCAGPLLCTPQAIELNDRPVYLSLYGTGIRGGSSIVVVKIDDEAVPVTYAGPQGQYAGLDQVNVRLDRSVRTRGERNITVTIGSVVSNAVRILLR